MRVWTQRLEKENDTTNSNRSQQPVITVCVSHPQDRSRRWSVTSWNVRNCFPTSFPAAAAFECEIDKMTNRKSASPDRTRTGDKRLSGALLYHWATEPSVGGEDNCMTILILLLLSAFRDFVAAECWKFSGRLRYWVADHSTLNWP